MFRQLSFVALFLLSTSSVNAATVILDQTWTGTLDSAFTIDTRSAYDDSTLTGIGIENVSIFGFSALQNLNGVGQLFNVGNLSSGSGFARYDGGIFQYIETTPNIPISTPNAAGVPNGGLTISALGASLLHGFETGGGRAYRLTSTVLPPAIIPSVVPVPAALLLFATALTGLFGVTRRKKMTHPVAV